MKKTILLLNYSSNWQATARIEGMRRFVKEVGWNLELSVSGYNSSSAKALIEFWHADGCIVEGNGGLKNNVNLPNIVPTVFVDASPDELPASSNIVYSEARSIAEVAARELLHTGYKYFAFASTPAPFYWNDTRKNEFGQILEMNGIMMHELQGEFITACSKAALQRFMRDIIALPKPIAIFAANDLVARGVVYTAEQAGFRVPGDIAVVGADNEPTNCESGNVWLSSVIIDFPESGYKAASMLAETIANPRLKGQRATYGATGIYRRASTPAMKQSNPLVLKALAFMRDHISEGITADDVAKAIGVSRRTAYSRFQEMTGMTIHDAINKIRLETIDSIRKAEPNITCEMLAAKVGLQSRASLWRLIGAKRSTAVHFPQNEERIEIEGTHH